VALGAGIFAAIVAVIFVTTDAKDLVTDIWVDVTSETQIEVKLNGEVEPLLREIRDELRKD